MKALLIANVFLDSMVMVSFAMILTNAKMQCHWQVKMGVPTTISVSTLWEHFFANVKTDFKKMATVSIWTSAQQTPIIVIQMHFALIPVVSIIALVMMDMKVMAKFVMT